DAARRPKERRERRQRARTPEAPERANRGLAPLPLAVGEPVDQYGNGLGRTDPAERPDRERAAPWNAPPRRTGEGVDRADLAERLERASALVFGSRFQALDQHRRGDRAFQLVEARDLLSQPFGIVCPRRRVELGEDCLDARAA